MEDKNSTNKIVRPPVVVIMGHIDHGKTTLLDYIRKTSVKAVQEGARSNSETRRGSRPVAGQESRPVAGRETGGITQHIGAYEIIHKEKKITFLDTPGHEAFSKIRARGARVADIAVLVVAADDGIKPQTLEALDHIKKAGLSFLVAINKIDKPGVNIEKVKKDLAESNILVESWGGQIPSVEISAKEGTGVNQLLDLIELLAEMADLRADFNLPASGVVLETHLDSRRGLAASLLILDGTLKIGDFVWTESAWGKVKIFEDFLGQAITEATFSSPATVIGFESQPLVGEVFNSGKTLPLLDFKKAFLQKTQSAFDATEKIIPVIIKADVQSSVEALVDSIQQISFEGGTVQILRADTGSVNESDIKQVIPGNGFLVAFRVKVDASAQNFLRLHEIKIIFGEVIYEVLGGVKKEIESRISQKGEREDLGKLEVLAIFRQDKDEQLIGGRVIEGRIMKGGRAEILRSNILLGQGRILSLQQNKADVSEVGLDSEAGLIFDSEIKVAVGDVLVIFKSLK